MKVAFPVFFRLFRSRSPGTEAASVPAGSCLYAMGDIHGENELLECLLDRIWADAAPLQAAGERVTLVFLGDYIDRGPNSKATLDRLIQLSQNGWNGCDCRFLRGNHEAAMLDFLTDPSTGGDWLAFGGNETLASYGVAPLLGRADAARLRSCRDALAEKLPPPHKDFLAALENSVCYGSYAMVHAGIRPGRPLEKQTADDLLWIREPFLSSTRRHSHVVVHGHTISDSVERRPNRIGIDTGAYASGILTALRLRGTEVHHLNTGRAITATPVDASP